MGYGDSWRELFDVVIANANKPEFYTSEHPFRWVSIALLAAYLFLSRFHVK